MTQMPGDLSTLLKNMHPLEGAFSPVVRTAGATSQGLKLCTLSDHVLERLMADATFGEPGGDAKMAAAYLMGMVSWSVCETLAGLAMRSKWLAAVEPDAVTLHERFAPWEEGGEKGVCLVFDLDLDVSKCAFVNFEAPVGLAASLEDIHRPLVEMLGQKTGLPRAALWRLVADSLAAAFVEHGRVLGQAEEAMVLARTLLRDRGSKLFNTQIDFEWTSLPEPSNVGIWARIRCECSRFYRSYRDGAEYCTTCVLRSAASRRERYQKYIRDTQTTS